MEQYETQVEDFDEGESLSAWDYIPGVSAVRLLLSARRERNRLEQAAEILTDLSEPRTRVPGRVAVSSSISIKL